MTETQAIAAGFTDCEAAVWEAVRSAAHDYLKLTKDEPAHDMEREEVCHAIHVMQGLLALRPTMRAMTGVARLQPVDPSKVTVDREVIERVLRDEGNAGGFCNVDHDALVAALGVMSPDPTSDGATLAEKLGADVVVEGVNTATAAVLHREHNAASPVAAEASPPKPAAWAWLSNAGYPAGATTSVHVVGEWRESARRVVPLYVIGEGQAIVDIDAVVHATATHIPLGGWSWAIVADALRETLGGASEGKAE